MAISITEVPEKVEEQVEEVAPAPITAPRLSDALRLGAAKFTQSFNGWGKQGAACAMSSAWGSMGYPVGPSVGAIARKYPEWGFLVESIDTRPLRKGICKRDCGEQDTLSDLIIHWNDIHKMSRERMADHLSGFGL